MEWYGPLTVLPAIALLILSTSNLITSLNTEVFKLEHMDEINVTVIKLKIDQLQKLGIAMAFLYASVLLFLLAGISKALLSLGFLMNWLMILGVVTTTIALVYLFIQSYKAVSVRKKHHQLK